MSRHLGEDVQSSLCNDARIERARQRCVINDAAARHIDHARTALHLGKCSIAKDALHMMSESRSVRRFASAMLQHSEFRNP